MAKFNGANLRYNNSDDQDRVYDLSAEVVIEDNKVTAVQNIGIVKDGNSLGNGSIYGIGSDYPNSSFNLSNVPHTDIKTAIGAMVDFAVGLMTQAVAEQSL